MNTKKAFTLIELLCIIGIIAILAGLIAGISGGGCNRSEGQRVGTLTKFSHSGTFKKSWEGELLVGGMRQTARGGAVADVWAFSVSDDAIAAKAEKLLGRDVLVRYRQTFMRNPLKIGTPYDVIAVEPLAAPKPETP